MPAGTVNAQALACSSMQAIAASDARHAAVFARVGAIPWLVGLIGQWPSHACGRNAAAALKEMLQDHTYQVRKTAQMALDRLPCGHVPVCMLLSIIWHASVCQTYMQAQLARQQPAAQEAGAQNSGFGILHTES